MCNEPSKRKRLGRSGTFMAQWFRRWTLESATRDRYPHGPLQMIIIIMMIDNNNNMMMMMMMTQTQVWEH